LEPRKAAVSSTPAEDLESDYALLESSEALSAHKLWFLLPQGLRRVLLPQRLARFRSSPASPRTGRDPDHGSSGGRGCAGSTGVCSVARPHPHGRMQTPELMALKFVAAVEGEKDANNPHRIGISAAYNNGGAGKLSPSWSNGSPVNTSPRYRILMQPGATTR